jgi:hypothetical protein
VRPAHRDFERNAPHPEQWLWIGWPKGESEPTKYWFSTEAADISRRELVKLAEHRWIIERDYEELKQELGLGHYEGRNGRGFHHHAALCIAAYGFLVAERGRFSPRHAPVDWSYASGNFRPSLHSAVRRVRAERHHPNSIATLPIKIARDIFKQLPCCPFCCGRQL